MKLMAGAVMAMSMLAGAAQAADWREVGTASDTLWVLDIDSIRTNGAVKRAWLTVINSATRYGADYRLEYSEVNCDQEEWGTVRWTAFAADGTIKHTNNDKQNLAAAIPGSIGDSFVRAVCRGQYANAGWPDVESAMAAYRRVLSRRN